MWFSSWLRKRAVSPKGHPARRFRPCLEVLEDRAVPATFLVNTPLDVLGHTNGMLSLRQAIIDANATPAADTITVPTGSYTLTRSGAGEDACLTGDLDINGPLTINGAGAGKTVIDGGGLDRVFQVLSGPVSLSGMTIQGGNASLGDTSMGSGKGGAVANFATLTVSDSIISGNHAYDGGGIYNVYPASLTIHNSTLSGNTAKWGGGIANYGTLAIDTSVISANSADQDGGGISNHGTLAVNQSTLSTNSAGHLGGGIYTQVSTTIDNSTLSANSAGPSRSAGYGGYGGGIYSAGSTLTVTSSVLTGNIARYGSGGGITTSLPTILTVRNSRFSSNVAAGQGGGIWNNGGTVTVSDSTFSGNSAYKGGGIHNHGALTVSSSTFSGNTGGYGGGIFNDSGLTVSGSTFSGNTARSGGGISNYGTLTVSASTFSGNAATISGGGIFNAGTLTLRGCTVKGNTAPLDADLYGTASLFDTTIGDTYYP